MEVYLIEIGSELGLGFRSSWECKKIFLSYLDAASVFIMPIFRLGKGGVSLF